MMQLQNLCMNGNLQFWSSAQEDYCCSFCYRVVEQQHTSQDHRLQPQCC